MFALVESTDSTRALIHKEMGYADGYMHKDLKREPKAYDMLVGFYFYCG